MPRRRYKPESLALIGTGLIGASIGLAARGRGFSVTGWDVSARALRGAQKRRAISRIAASLQDAVASSDIVVLAAPLDATLAHLRQVFEFARPGTLVIDVAGVKEPVSKRAAALLARRRDVCFVAGHPIAGSEHSGPAAADAKLFARRAFALYAPPQTSRTQAYEAAARFVRKLGAVPLRIAPRDHDRAMAALSALPQLASIAVALASGDSGAAIERRLAGPGYRDATRLAESGFAMWKPALSANRANVLRSIRAMSKRVSVIQAALQRRDWRVLGRLFSAAGRERRRVNPR
ncbi:MAG TPA: prephenate dehydrogenase/arogenate dehydrogenase family protein [Candidatus Eremiobacteraceae bacterium]